VLLRTAPDGVISRTLAAVADELARVDARAKDLLNEADPRTAVETLDDWERVVSLPDAQVPAIPATTGERQTAITQKWTTRGGQSLSYFSQLSAACGWVLDSITLSSVLRAGFRVNDRCYESTYAYTINFHLRDPRSGALSTANLERVLRHATHAHIITQFTYV
jgi:uncharacterized protein YmfQ (DUF2313 family)